MGKVAPLAARPSPDLRSFKAEETGGALAGSTSRKDQWILPLVSSDQRSGNESLTT